MRQCHYCGVEWNSDKAVPGVKEFCEHCDAYLHCCLNCRYYDPAVAQQCAIPNIEYIADKAGASFCDEFEFRVTQGGAKTDSGEARARAAFSAMFGDQEGPPGTPDGATGREGFRRLFGE